MDPPLRDSGRGGERADLQHFHRGMADVGENRLCDGGVFDLWVGLLHGYQYSVWRDGGGLVTGPEGQDQSLDVPQRRRVGRRHGHRHRDSAVRLHQGRGGRRHCQRAAFPNPGHRVRTSGHLVLLLVLQVVGGAHPCAEQKDGRGWKQLVVVGKTSVQRPGDFVNHPDQHLHFCGHGGHPVIEPVFVSGLF